MFFGNTIFSSGIQGRSPKGHNHELWRTFFSYKHVWMAWAGVIYHGKCNYCALLNCIRDCVRREFIQNYFKIFSFLLIWGKNLGSHTGWPVAKPLWIGRCRVLLVKSCIEQNILLLLFMSKICLILYCKVLKVFSFKVFSF